MVAFVLEKILWVGNENISLNIGMINSKIWKKFNTWSIAVPGWVKKVNKIMKNDLGMIISPEKLVKSLIQVAIDGDRE